MKVEVKVVVVVMSGMRGLPLRRALKENTKVRKNR
jgi:hypothetical protein